MDIQTRINYYLNNIEKSDIKEIDEKYFIKNNKIFKPNCLHILNYDKLVEQLNSRGHPNFRHYGITLYLILKKFVEKNPSNSQKKFLCRWGDEHRNIDQYGNMITIPFFTKTRQINNKTGVLLNFNRDRHWGNVKNVKVNDIEFKDKINKVVWRGSTTGENDDAFSFKRNRLLCVERFYNHKSCDIGFSNIVQNINIPKEYLKKILTIREQLKYKYILSIEGNDVSSGLKWQLYSNSVVFMRKPKIVSWAMEDTLIPYKHYIPINDDFSDLISQIDFANKNVKICLEIIKNANEFIEQFLDKKKEEVIEFMVIKEYLNSVHFN